MADRVTHPGYFCSAASAAAEEQIFGTASRGDVWMLLEYPGHWEVEAFADSHLSPVVKERISHYLHTIPHSRLHFIKHERHREKFINLFVALTREDQPVMYKFKLTHYEDLLYLDIPALLANPELYAPNLTTEPIFLTCTHGKHDKCCALWGRPVYKELHNLVGLNAWQASHLGGDRFSANLACFPDGLYYGRVDPTEVGTIVAEYRQRRLYLEKLRGRVCYNFVTQVGEHFLRQETGLRDLPGYRFLTANKAGGNLWVVQFAAAADQKIHTLTLQRNPGTFVNYMTCNSAKKGTVAQHQLVSHLITPQA